MKAEQISISSFSFLTIESMEIDQQVGQHATGIISGYIHDDDVEDYKLRVLENRWITVTAEDENGDKKILMGGVIAGFSFEMVPHATRMRLNLKSGTYLMDGARHFRSFQNMKMTYLDVMKHINESYGSYGVIAESCIETTPIDFLLQYQETDWSFIKRLASRFGLEVTPAITREGVFYYVGGADKTSYQLTETNYSVSKHVDAFMTHRANGTGGLNERDYLEYRVSTRELYDLWNFLILRDAGGYIHHIHREYRQGELYNIYTLRQDNGMKTTQMVNECQAGCSFQATVSRVMQDMVQISIAGDENSGQDINRWFPFSTGYSSPDGPGWYCMPETGDRVRLQIPDCMEEHGYVISAVHLETGKDRLNPDYKSFKTKYGKELLFTPDSVELTNHQGMSIKIKDGEGIQIVSSRNISISAGGNMTLSSEDASLVIAGTQSVDIRQGGAGLHMDKDITFSGGKFRIQ